MMQQDRLAEYEQSDATRNWFSTWRLPVDATREAPAFQETAAVIVIFDTGGDAEHPRNAAGSTISAGGPSATQHLPFIMAILSQNITA